MSEAKRRAQEALFTAIADQAETNMKAALRAPEKAALLHELAEAGIPPHGRHRGRRCRRAAEHDAAQRSGWGRGGPHGDGGVLTGEDV